MNIRGMFNLNSDENNTLRKSSLIELLNYKEPTIMEFSYIPGASSTFRNCYRAESDNFEVIVSTQGILRNLFCDACNLIMGDTYMLLTPTLDEIENSIGKDETDNFISEHSLDSYKDTNQRMYNSSVFQNETRIGTYYNARPGHFDKEEFMDSLDKIIGLNVELKEKMNLI